MTPRRELEAVLAKLNRARRYSVTQPGVKLSRVAGDTAGQLALESFLQKLLAGDNVVIIPGPALRVFRRDGPRISYESAPGEEASELAASLLALIRLVNIVGADRVRQCKLPGCSKWFIAVKNQQHCSLKHGNRASYLAYRARQIASARDHTHKREL